MRKQVIDAELEQLKKICIDEYNIEASEEGKAKMPHITLLIVNKRIRQRFFEKTGKSITNPPQGTYVDSAFVE